MLNLILTTFSIFFILNSIVVGYEVKIVAKVNNEIITNIDLENRLKLALELSNLPNESELRERLKPRVLDSLIDEALKIQEANRLGIFVTNKEVTDQINILEERLKIEKNTLLKEYKIKEIPEITIINQIRSQLLWEKLLYGIIIKNVTVSEKKISETYDLLLKKSGETEYNISEIFISSDNLEAEERVNSIYTRVNNQNFLLLAEQFSDGVVFLGNLRNNWARESLLDENIKRGIFELDIGEISQPLKSSSGYHIILLNDKRKTKKIKENQTIYDLSQILFKTDNKADKNSEAYYIEFLLNLKNIITGCNDLNKLIEEIPEGYGGQLGKIEAKNIEKKFLTALKDLSVGKLSDAILTEDGIHGLMLCSPVTNNTYDEFKNSIEANLRRSKIDSAAQSLLSRIKRKALIEINNL
tara:strand:+ start:819 stop:2060 length:1242 start_codon:yes stop_codon:yes gene_type:complete